MRLSKIIYLQNQRLELSKDAFSLTWQKQTRANRWNAGLLVLLLGTTVFLLGRKTVPTLFTGITDYLFSILLTASRVKNLSQSMQTDLDSKQERLEAE